MLGNFKQPALFISRSNYGYLQIMIKKLLHIIPFLFLFFLLITGCKKEYSYEGGDAPDMVRDTTSSPIITAPWVCPSCVGQDTWIEDRWSFFNQENFFCGEIDTSVVNPERTAFTFFGPSACSADSGMIVSVFLNGRVLNSNQSHIVTERAVFYYYDNIGQTHPLISRSGIPFTVIIESYNHQTRLAHGTFSGPVFRPDGSGTAIASGKFKVKLM